jgi:hypothetical protein
LAEFLELDRKQVRHPEAARKLLGDIPAAGAPRIHVHFLQ